MFAHLRLCKLFNCQSTLMIIEQKKHAGTHILQIYLHCANPSLQLYSLEFPTWSPAGIHLRALTSCMKTPRFQQLN